MKLLILTLIIPIISSCGKEFRDVFLQEVKSDPRSRTTTNPIFKNITARFQYDYRKLLGDSINISHIPINFANLESKVAGACYIYSSSSEKWKEIKIDISYWNNASTITRQLLIYHELSHCALGRDHFNDYHHGYPISVMNKIVISGKIYRRHESLYNIELFTKNATPIKRAL